MKKLSVLVILSTLLTGCFWQTVSQWDIERAIEKCGGLEKVVEIAAMSNGDEKIMCKVFDK